jgi:hypothetical protein
VGKSKEQKVAEALAELAENHYFNPAVFGRLLADQPIYSIDRIMEMVVQIIHYQSQRYETELKNERTSEGLILANELKQVINLLKAQDELKTIKLPN